MSKSETPVTVPQIRSRKGKTKISCLTAYDFPTARFMHSVASRSHTPFR
jgi:hypothetical protein